jgi:hypothetical protein
MRLELGNMSRAKWIGTIAEYRINWGGRDTASISRRTAMR